MAFEGNQPVKLQGAVAGADLSAASAQYKFVKYNGTDNQVVLVSNLTDVPCGVLQAPAPSAAVGTPVEVVAIGVTKVQIGAAAGYVSGDLVGVNTSGQAIEIDAGGETTQFIVGQFMATQGGGTAAGDLATVVVNCASPARAA